MPVAKKSEAELDWSETETEELMNTIKAPEGAGEQRDGTSYFVEYNEKRTKIDWEKIPSGYMQVFEKMKDDLQIVTA